MSVQSNRDACKSQGVFQRILVAVDNTEPSGWAVQVASRMAAESNAMLALVHVIPIDEGVTPEFAMMRDEILEDRRAAGKATLQQALASIDSAVHVELLMKGGRPSQQVIAAAREWNADIIVIGTHGRCAVAHMLLGSTAESVVRHAHAPVLTIGCAPAEKRHAAAVVAVEAAKIPAAATAGKCGSTGGCGCGRKASTTAPAEVVA